MNEVKTAIVPPFVMDAVEHVTGACPATVFYDADGNALILGDDHTWIARITHDTVQAYTEEAYLCTVPLEDFSSEDVNDLPEYRGFEAGFTA